MRRLSLFVVAALFTITPCFSTDFLPDGKFTHYFSALGMPSDFVSDIVQDQGGNVWFATGYISTFSTLGCDPAYYSGGNCNLGYNPMRWGVPGRGVVRYDGRQFVTYTTSNGLPSNTAQALLHDGNSLWVGTAAGLARSTGALTGAAFSMVTQVNGQVSDLALDGFGRLWVSTLGSGVYRITYTSSGISTVTQYTKANTSSRLVSNTVTGMDIQNGANRIWFATDEGVFPNQRELGQGGASYADFTSSSATFTAFSLNDIGPGTIRECDPRLLQRDLNRLYDVHVDNAGNVWFAIAYSGVLRGSGTDWTFFDHTDGVGTTEVWRIEDDPSGNLWFSFAANGIATEGTRAAVAVVPQDQLSAANPPFEVFTPEDGLDSAFVLAVYFHDSKVVWFGYQGMGANRLGGPLEEPGFPVATDGYIYTSSPNLADLNNDGDLEIIVGDQAGKVYAFHPDGQTYWEYDTRNAIRLGPGESMGDISVQSSPAVGDVDGDGRPEVVVGVGGFSGPIGPQMNNINLGQAALVILSHDGLLQQSVMTYDITNGNVSYSPRDGLREGVFSTPALDNLDDDPELEIVFGAFDNFIYAINGDGTPAYSVDNDADGRFDEDFFLDFTPYTPMNGEDDAPGFEGVDDDGDGVIDEGAAADDDEDGLIDEDWPEWPFSALDTTVSSAAIADIDGDGKKDVVVGHDASGSARGGVLQVLSAQGEALPNWPRANLEQVVWSSPALGDLDGDGQLEIFHGSGLDLSTTDDVQVGEQFYAWNHDASSLVSSSTPGLLLNTQGRTFSSPALGDVDGDGEKEIVFLSTVLYNKDGNPIDQNGNVVSLSQVRGQLLYAVNPDGTLLPGFPLRPFPFVPNTHVLSSPALADVNHDGRQDIIVTTGWGALVFDALTANPLDGMGVFQNLQDLQSQWPVQSSPAIGDIDLDGKLELVWGAPYSLTPGGAVQGGMIQVFELGTNAYREWPMFRRTPNRTGALTLQVALPQAIPNKISFVAGPSSATVKLVAFVLPGTAALQSVSVDASSVGLGIVQLNDAGQSGDIAEKDSYYSRDIVVNSSVRGGQHRLPLTATGGGTAQSCIILNVITQSGAQLRAESDLDFGDVYLGSTSQENLVISNPSSQAVTIIGFEATVGDYSLVKPESTVTRNLVGSSYFDFPWTIAAGGARTLDVRFRPNAAGDRSGVLCFLLSGGGRLEVQAVGHGLTATNARMETNATQVPFPHLDLGATANYQVFIQSTGTSPLEIQSVTANHPAYSIHSASLPRVIAPGSSLEVVVEFRPTKVGNQNATLTIRTNATNGSVKELPITAFGMPSAAGDSGSGYVMLGEDGGVFNFGSSRFHGSLPALGIVPVGRLTVIKNTASEAGYYMMGLDGGIFAFGDAGFYGSLPAIGIFNNPTVDMEPSPTGHGYYVLGTDGGIFAFGDCPFYGSLPALGIQTRVLDMEITPTGQGYWILGEDGGIFSFGDAQFQGSLPALGIVPWKPLKKIKSTATGRGYYLIGEDGGIYAFGDAVYQGSLPAISVWKTAVDMEITPSGNGYYILTSDGAIYPFGYAPDRGDILDYNIVTTLLDMDVNVK